MTLIEQYKEVDKELNNLLMNLYGRCDRNNIDIKNSNPPVLLQTLAILRLAEKIDNLCEILSQKPIEEKKASTKKTTTK